MFCTQNQLITEHAPVYPYEAVIRLKLTVSIRLTAVNITAVNSQVWGLDGTGVLPVQPYRTNRNIRLRCAALLAARGVWWWRYKGDHNCRRRWRSDWLRYRRGLRQWLLRVCNYCWKRNRRQLRWLHTFGSKWRILSYLLSGKELTSVCAYIDSAPTQTHIH